MWVEWDKQTHTHKKNKIYYMSVIISLNFYEVSARNLLGFWLRWCIVVWFALIWFGFRLAWIDFVWSNLVLFGLVWLRFI